MPFFPHPLLSLFRSRPGKPNQKKAQNEKFINFAHFCEFWCFSLGKQARFTLNFCSGMPLREVHELTFLWFGLPGPLLSLCFHTKGIEAGNSRAPRRVKQCRDITKNKVHVRKVHVCPPLKYPPPPTHRGTPVAQPLSLVAFQTQTQNRRVLPIALGNLQKCVGGFLLYKFWRILPGIFLEDFSGHFYPQKMRRKNPAGKSAKKSGGSKIKIREKSVLPKAGPKKSPRFTYAISQIAPLPPVVALNRSSKSQIAARYAAFRHAVSQIALASFL